MPVPYFDFGYTGHYTHTKSGLALAPYRAYDPDLARWLSRDPIGETEGANLYRYVSNDPISFADPLGLYKKAWFKLEFTVEKCEIFIFYGHNTNKDVKINTPEACSAAGASTCYPGTVNSNITHPLPNLQMHDQTVLAGSSSDSSLANVVKNKNIAANNLGYDIDGDAQVAQMRLDALAKAQEMLNQCCKSVTIREYRNGIGPDQNPDITITK